MHAQSPLAGLSEQDASAFGNSGVCMFGRRVSCCQFVYRQKEAVMYSVADEISGC